MRRHLLNLLRSMPALHRLAVETRRAARRSLRHLAPARIPEWPGPVADWRDASRDIPVPPGLTFHDIAVVPARRFYHRDLMFDGGPVWPDFDTTPLIRHSTHQQFVDVNARPGWRRGPVLSAPVIWGGLCYPHFGHLVAEHVSRWPGALYHHPDAQVLLTLPPDKSIGDLPGYVWAVAAWFGIPPRRIRFVTAPLVAPTLHVAAQAEPLGLTPPPDWYLDLLDELPRLNRLQPVVSDAVYVHRLGEAARGNAAHAGEAALVAALRRAGVAILDPATASLEEQLAHYAGARLLIFAEGSAMHGRQLLGRIDQTILVLRRRPGSTLAKPQLTPRCRVLDYAAILQAFATPVRPDGTRITGRGLAFYRVPALIAALQSHGIDLTPYWDETAYRPAATRDALAWRDAVLAQGDVDPARTMADIRAEFAKAGFAHLL